MAQV
jgi:hypothetical protein